MRARLLFIPLTGALCLACGSDGEPRPAPPATSADPRQNVLVIDDGFDPGHPALAGRVAAQYQVTCPRPDPVEIVPRPEPPEVRRAAVLAELAARDESCHLQPGIPPKPDPLADVSTYRPAWNRLVEQQRPPDEVFTPAQQQAILRGQQLSRGRYHGTATAGLVAHANPNVRLVLVELMLGAVDDERPVTCRGQEDYDATVALFSDPEVARAYVERPPSALDQEIANVEASHRVGLRNESFGYPSRAVVEAALPALGCSRVDLRAYYVLRGELDRRRAEAHPGSPVLVMKSAGNDGAELAGPEDSFECSLRSPLRLVVGAYDLAGQRASFSNAGPCVDVSAPGVNVIAPLPGGWLMPVDGTSFSAPLLVRLVSLEAGPFDPAAARQAVLDGRDAGGRIPFARFPRELFYDPGRISDHWALTVREARVLDRRALRRLNALLALGRRP